MYHKKSENEIQSELRIAPNPDNKLDPKLGKIRLKTHMTFLPDSIQNTKPNLRQMNHDTHNTMIVIRQKLSKFSAGFGVMKIKPFKILNAPCTFGEEFFNDKKTRETLAIALVNTKLLIFNEEAYQKILHDRENFIKRRRTFFMTYFKFANKNAAEILAQYMEPVNVKVGKRIYNEGDELDALYFIESGEIKVTKHLNIEL